MLDTKLYTDKSITKIKCDAPDIPIINYDNAILILDKDDDYIKTFKTPTLSKGLLSHKGNHFYFEHNIVETPSSYLSKPNSVHSYDVYQITPELTDKIIQTKIALHWEVYFNSFNYFGKRLLTIRHGDFIEWYTYSSYRNEDGLVLPYSVSPSDLNRMEGITIGGYLEKHKKNYPKNGQELEFNISVWRNYKLELFLA
jgi:hypothetical protein